MGTQSASIDTKRNELKDNLCEIHNGHGHLSNDYHPPHAPEAGVSTSQVRVDQGATGQGEGVHHDTPRARHTLQSESQGFHQ
jgi:hypothetical protein